MSDRAAEVRERLDHPVIDADGHVLEFVPAVLSVVREVGGPGAEEHLRALLAGTDPAPQARILDFLGWHDRSWDERRDRRIMRVPWWVAPTANTVDRATAMLPRFLHSRLPELGIDFAVCYPSLGLLGSRIADAELRQIVCRSLNLFYAQLFDGLGDRLTPVAVIPTHTPDEALEELDFAVTSLGYKAVMILGGILRPIPALERAAPDEAFLAPWFDVLALDSDYDYDPVWARCAELGVAVASHGGTMGVGTRRSLSNFVFNHSGHFAAAGEALAKALLLGGVTHRFPGLNFAFLEGGVAWAVALLNDLVELWEKRNGDAVALYDPRRVDVAAMAAYFERYGTDRYASLVREDLSTFGALSSDREDPAMRDEWRACGATTRSELADLFVGPFHFGCEADDLLTSVAFDRRVLPTGEPLKAMFSSDIGHYDIPDMAEVVPEAYELVAHELLDPADFERLVFSNAAGFYTRGNPDFFRGTAVEHAVDALRPFAAATDAPEGGA